MRRRGAVLLLALVGAGTARAATVIEPATLRELARDATLIIRGHVTHVRAMASPGRGIESIATIAVTRVIKGDADPFLSVRVPGGVVGRSRHVVLGAPSLRPGQQAVFFLARDRENAWRTVGLSAGVVPIRTEAATGRVFVQPPIVAGHTAALGPITRGDSGRRTLAVDEFEALVALVIATPPSPGGDPASR